MPKRNPIAFSCLVALVPCAAVLVASSASAHVKLTTPAARHAQDTTGDPQKTGPCGVGGASDVRGSNVTVYKPGQTIDVVWDETISHPGHFRILFDPNGQTFPDPTSFTDVDAGGSKTLADNIAHQASGPYRQSVTLPNVECTNCTLQLMQVMTDKPPFGPGGGNDFYYHCADITLSNATPVVDAGARPSDAGTSTGKSDASSSGTSRGDDSNSGDEAASGGCSVTNQGPSAPHGNGTSAPSSGFLMVFAGIFSTVVLRLRRRTV